MTSRSKRDLSLNSAAPEGVDVFDDDLGMSLKTLELEVARLPESDREEAEDAVTAVGTVLIHDTNALMHVARLVRPDMVDGEPPSALAQEARNLRRVFALCRRAGEESLTADDLGVNRQQLEHLPDGGELVALRFPMRRELVYPAWQFDSTTGQPFDGIGELMDAAEEAKLSPLGLHLHFGAAAADKLGEMKPAQKTVILAIEETEMSDEERAARLEALWSRMLDPDGLDWETLENIEQLTERSR